VALNGPLAAVGGVDGDEMDEFMLECNNVVALLVNLLCKKASPDRPDRAPSTPEPVEYREHIISAVCAFGSKRIWLAFGTKGSG
jgi:hypothetical protein